MKCSAVPTLSFGQIYGQLSACREAAGFMVSAARPVVPPDEIPLHTHPEGAFTFILSGFQISSARGAADGGFAAGSVIWNPPGTTHRDRMQNHAEGRCLSISVPYAITDSVALPAMPTRLPGHEAIGLIRAIARECAAWDATSPIVVESLCLELVAATASPLPRRRGTIPRWLTRAQELLTDQCTQTLSITAVAAAVGVHPAHLARNFSRFFLRSPGEHLRRSRVARAATLLRDTDLPLAGIALACGFTDQSHFSNVFRRYQGLSPAVFRCTHQTTRCVI